MNLKYLVLVCLVLFLIPVPASAIYEWSARQVGMADSVVNTSSPIYGAILLGGGYNPVGGYGGVRNDTYYSPPLADGGIWISRGNASWTARYGAKFVSITNNYDTYWTLLAGNGGGGTFLNDTWITADDGVGWTNLSIASPTPWRAREYHIAVASKVNKTPDAAATPLILLAGGRAAVGLLNDTWISADGGSTWASKGNASWSARRSAAAVALPNGKIVIIAGMNVSGNYLNDVWTTSNNGTSWVQTKASYGESGGGSFMGRLDPAVWALADGSIMLYGGNAVGQLGDVWRSTDEGATWTQISSPLGAPGVREGAMTAYYPAEDMIIVMGGIQGAPWLSDTWYSRDKGSSWDLYASYNYTTAGTYNWQAPIGVRNLTMNIAGAGGGGAPSPSGGNLIGNGGSAGQYGNYTGLPVLNPSSYSVTVGLNGTTANLSFGSGYPGTSSTAFGKSKAGGAGGTMGAGYGAVPGTYVGGTGATTNFMTLVQLANSGGYPGVGGTGYGAGGGGGGYFCAAFCTGGQGGAGAPGTVRFFTDGSWGENTPDFTVSPTTTAAGTAVTFTDATHRRNLVDLTYLWDFGDGTTSTTQGSINHTYTYPGSFTVSLTVGSTTGEYTREKENLVTVTSASNSQVWYSPNQVRITVLDYLGNNIAGARVNATYVESTMPDAAAWLSNVYGVSSSIAIQMLSTSTNMTGLTGDDGAVVFTMHSSLQYNVTVSSGSTFMSQKLYPKESDYNIWLPAIPSNNTYAQIGYNLTFWEPNASYYTMGATYQDNSSQTMRVTFYVNATNGTSINYTTMTNPGSNLLNVTKTIPNIRGDAFYWGLNVVRSTPDMSGKGNISASRGVTSRGANGVLVDLSLPNGTTYYPWIAFFLLLMITSLASKANVRFMLVIMAVMAAMFWWFGWLQGIYLTTVIPFACFLGAIFYMKGSLRENYGVGGSGSMLVNIVVFLIILQMMIGFINGIGIFNQAAMMTPSNQFTNVDLTTIQNTTSNFGGINDPLQSANAYASIGWATFKILLMMIGAVFVVAPFLIEMFPYVPATFFLILQAGIWVIYVLFIAKAAGKLGSEVDF